MTLVVQKIPTVHVCWFLSCGGRSFGTKAAESWSRRMQHAEGPKDFERGYRKMLTEFGTDINRTQYINTLYHDDGKAHFKRNLRFSNGVLVDVCEIFISALKRWVYGSSTRSPSMYMAVVRIVGGCRRLVQAPFLKPTQMSITNTVSRTGYTAAKKLFRYLSDHLTVWATKRMYQTLDRVWMSYELISV